MAEGGIQHHAAAGRIDAGGQAALLAPTEVLAQQHWRTLERALVESRVRRLLLTGALSPKERRLALERIRASEIDLVVGTQALVQEDVQFARLGLVVIEFRNDSGTVTTSIPSERQLEAYQRWETTQLGPAPAGHTGSRS